MSQALYNFMPSYCPRCGREIEFSDIYARQDWRSGCGHTCNCGLRYRYNPHAERIGDMQDEGISSDVLVAAPDFHAACRGQSFPDVSRLDWLAGILTDVGCLFDGEATIEEVFQDRDAYRTALSEADDLLTDLRAAQAKTEGRTDAR